MGPATQPGAADLSVVIEQILAARRPVALAVTGGGSLALNWLVGHPGASRAIVDAQIPYHATALSDYVGQAGPHGATPETARKMAMVAARRARRICGQTDVIGIGVTAALATNRVRKGADRAHVTVRAGGVYYVSQLLFNKDQTDRAAQEQILSFVLIDLLAEALKTQRLTVPLTDAVATRIDRQDPIDACVEDLLSCTTDAVQLSTAGPTSNPARQHRLLVSGSFNPLHDGHRGLLRAAQDLSGRRGCLELSVRNVDKPDLGYAEIMERWAAIRREGFDLLVTREPTFDGKARLFPGCDFAIGYDTAARVIEPRYYGSDRQMARALDELLTSGTRFFVAGRVWEGTYHGLSSLEIPTGYQKLFVEIPEQAFRADISSTELRQGGELTRYESLSTH